MNFNDTLVSSLNILYEYSSNCKISIDLVQKLSQLLKLDTFVDVDAYAHIIDQPLMENGDQLKFQRLSIAGSLILIDIDYIDKRILRVSFSSANLLEPIPNSETSIPQIQKQKDIHVIPIDFTRDKGPSILTKDDSGNIEQILLSNLNCSTLDNFPANLKFLANLDRLSNPTTDLFIYIDSIALILETLFKIETEKSDDWLVKEGLLNGVGKISANNSVDRRIGIFIDFWKDFKHINHEYNKTTEGIVAGKNHGLLIDFSPKEDKPVDYIGESREHTWNITGEKYQFTFDDDTYMMAGFAASESTNQPRIFPNCTLNLTFNDFIYLPINVIEFIGIQSYEESTKTVEFFDELRRDREIFLLVEEDKNLKFVVDQQVPEDFIPVKSIAIKRLADIPCFLTVFRNFLVLTNLLQELRAQCSHHKGSKFEIALEATNKLKDSLKLDDVTDEQLLSLGAINTQNFQNEDEDITLDEFMRDTEDDPKPQSRDNELKISITDVSYCNNYEISLKISGKFKTYEVSHELCISNGVIKKANKVDDEMEIDNEKNEKFIKSLELTEDIIKSMNYVYLNQLN